MKKFIYSFILFLVSLFITQNVDAAIAKNNFFDPSQYDFSTEWEKIDNNYGEVNNRIFGIIETSDGGLLLVIYYKESAEKIAGIDPTTNQLSGTYTFQMDHSKLVKLNANYEIEWITKYYATGNWSNADHLAPTVQSTINNISELPDGSFVATGKVWGYQSSSTTISSGDAFFIRVSKTGEIIYKYNYQNNGVKNAAIVGYTEDGNYVIAYKYESDKSSEHPDFAAMDGVLKPDNFSVSESGIYYVIYDKNNQIIESFYETKISEMLKKYSFNEIFKYITQDKGEYIGIDNRGYVTYKNYDKDTEETSLYFYDPGNMTLVNKFVIPDKLAYERIFFTNNGNLLIGDTVYDVNGNFKHTYKINTEKYDRTTEDELERENILFKKISPTNFRYNDINFIKKNGDLINITYNNYHKQWQYLSVGGYDMSILNIKKSDSSLNKEDPVKYIINGGEVEYNLGTFIENDRIYIKLSNLCSVMGCSYLRGVGDNNNMLVIKFDATSNNKMLDLSNNAGHLDYIETIFEKDEYGLMYTITHEIGSKTYHAYLEYQPYTVFVLKSPTYDANAVDVASKEIDGEIYVPIRFISEAIGRYVDYTPATETEKAIVTIHSYGEGEFFEKYALAASTSKLSNGDTITNIQTGVTNNISYKYPLTYIELPWKNTEYLYGYGYEVATKKIVSTEKTLWLSMFEDLASTYTDDFLGYLPYDGRDQLHYWAGGGNFNGKYDVLLVEVNKNVLGKNEKWDLSYLADYENCKEVTDETNNEECKSFNETREEVEEVNNHFYPFFLISNIEGYPFVKFYTLH